MHSGHRDRSRSAGRIARESAENLTRWRQARRGGKSDKRRGKSIILRLLETLIQIFDATQELDFTYIGSRRRNYVQGVIESIRSNQWLPKNHEPILEGWEESDLDSDLGESLYTESEAEEEFVPSNEPLRPTSRYSDYRPEPVLLSANPSIAPSSVLHQSLESSGAASSTDPVSPVIGEPLSEEDVIDAESYAVNLEQPLEPLPPPAEYLVDWSFLKRAGVTLADPSKGEVMWAPETGDPLAPPFQGKILCSQRSCFSVDYHNVLDAHRTSWRSASRYWDSVGEPCVNAIQKLAVYFHNRVLVLPLSTQGQQSD